MANEVTTLAASAGELVQTNVVDAIVLQELRANQFMDRFARVKDLRGLPTKTASFPKWPTSSASALTEGNDPGNTTLNTTEISITAAEIALQFTITELLKESAVTDIDAEAVRMITRALMAKYNSDIAALLSGFSTTAGTTNVAQVVSDLIDAIAAINRNNGLSGATGVIVLHPNQVRDIQKNASSGSGGGLAPAMARQDLVNLFGEAGSVLSATPGTFMNVPVFQTTDTPTMNAGADRGGAVFAVPAANSGQAAIGIVMKRPPAIEILRSVSAVGDQVRGSMAYGTAEIDDLRGVTIVGKA